MTPTTWTTKDGQTLLISEMTTSHLKNTVRMLERKASRLQEQARANDEDLLTRALAFSQGEMACDALESQLSRVMWDDTIPQHWLETQPIYRALRRELRRRKEPV